MSSNRKSAVRHHLAPSVPLELTLVDKFGSRKMEFALAFDFNSFALIEEKTGENMLLAGPFFDDLNANKLRVAFWAALQVNHQDDYSGDEGVEVVGPYITVANAAQTREGIKDAFVACLPPEIQKAIKEATAAAVAGEPGVAGEVPLESPSEPVSN